jgi:thioredoxin reductase
MVGENIGGQLMYANIIENFPAFSGSGYDLIKSLKKQAEAAGAELINERVIKIEKQNGRFKVTSLKGNIYTSKTIIIASGKSPRKLGVPGEEIFLGKGVHMCSTCDAPLYKGKKAAIIGGGNSAVHSAINLSGIAAKVYLINVNKSCNADDVLIKKIRSLQNVETLHTSNIKEIRGDRFVSSIIIEDIAGGKQREIKVDGVFVDIGYVVDPSLFESLVKLNDKKEIIIEDGGETSCEGVFAAGDVTDTIFKQAIIAAGCGAKAALSAYAHLTDVKVSGNRRK